MAGPLVSLHQHPWIAIVVFSSILAVIYWLLTPSVGSVVVCEPFLRADQQVHTAGRALWAIAMTASFFTVELFIFLLTFPCDWRGAGTFFLGCLGVSSAFLLFDKCLPCLTKSLSLLYEKSTAVARNTARHAGLLRMIHVSVNCVSGDDVLVNFPVSWTDRVADLRREVELSLAGKGTIGHCTLFHVDGVPLEDHIYIRDSGLEEGSVATALVSQPRASVEAAHQLQEPLLGTTALRDHKELAMINLFILLISAGLHALVMWTCLSMVFGCNDMLHVLLCSYILMGCLRLGGEFDFCGRLQIRA